MSAVPVCNCEPENVFVQSTSHTHGIGHATLSLSRLSNDAPAWAHGFQILPIFERYNG
jgi:hypothetical protein